MSPTALRGAQYTDSHGHLSFQTVFPGRSANALGGPTAPHISFVVHLPSGPAPVTRGSNGHLVQSVLHSGQIFFDDTLVAYIHQNEPYKSSKVGVAKNKDDGNWMAEWQGGKDVKGKDLDPVAWYKFSGRILAFIGVGVDVNKKHQVPIHGV
jgi:protocatechuate 3,4-dioxygenase beta subunit